MHSWLIALGTGPSPNFHANGNRWGPSDGYGQLITKGPTCGPASRLLPGAFDLLPRAWPPPRSPYLLGASTCFPRVAAVTLADSSLEVLGARKRGKRAERCFFLRVQAFPDVAPFRR